MEKDEFDILADLDGELADTSAVVQAFSQELGRLKKTVADTGKDMAVLERGIGRGLRKALDGVVLDGMKASDALKTVAKSLINTTYAAAVKPVTDRAASLLADGLGAMTSNLLAFENGGSFSQGRVMPFAKGGVISSPTTFPMRSGTGLMGEAGPEAIMPLSRGADGSLGVRMQGGGRPISIVMNVQTPDVQGFQRSQSQIAAQLSRALSRGGRNR
jgi:hypothetical protein